MALAPITFRGDGDWGTGKGAPLTVAELDTNFWGVLQRIIEAAAAAGNPVGIASITLVGSQMTITLTDATVFTFTIPVSRIKYRGEFAAVAYVGLDLITVTGVGIFLVLQPHTGVLPFDPDRTISGNPAYAIMFPAPELAVRQVKVVSASTYEPILTDRGKLLLMTNAGGCVVSFPAGVMTDNDELYFVQMGAGAVMFEEGATDVVFSAKPSRELFTDGVGSHVYFKNIGDETWIRAGEFAPVEVTA